MDTSSPQPDYSPPPPPSRRSLDPDEQPVEERAALLLRDPLDLRVAEAGVQGLAVTKRLGSHLVGAGTHAHLESHLSLVAAVRAGVLKSARRTENRQNKRANVSRASAVF